MTFANFSLLFGALFVAVPIVMHLVMRQQPQHMQFPPLWFLQLKQQSNRRRLRLRHLLLLALRIAAISLLALALARPSIKGSGILGGQEAPVAAALVFDTSPRMDYRHENQTRLEAATDLADWLLPQLPENSQVSVIDCRSMAPAFAVDVGAAKQQIDRLRITPVARSLPDMLESALVLLKEGPQHSEAPDVMRREVYLFTDLSRSGWETVDRSRLERQLEELAGVGIYVIDVGVADPRNFALVDLRLSREILAQQSPLSVSIELVRDGPDETREVELYLIDADGQERKRGQETVEWKESEVSHAEFRIASLEQGTHQGFVRIAGRDGLAWDDVRYFSVDVRPPWQILVAADRPGDAIYLTEALAPTTFRESGQARFQCQVIDLEQLSGERLSDYAAVCLLDPPPLANSVWNQLADYATGGGSIALLLGGNARLAEFNDAAAQGLLPGKLQIQSRQETYLAPRDLSHAMLASFRPVETSIPWNAFPVFKYWHLTSIDDDVTTIIPYATGQPALLEQPLGRGRVLTMTTPVSDPVNVRGRNPWNVLPTGIEPWPFVMLANEMMLYLVGSQNETLNYQAGESAILHTSTPLPTSSISVTLPTGENIRQTVDPGKDAILINTTDQPGNYRVRAGGRQRGLDRGFSVNLDPRQSEMERLGSEDLEELLGKDRFRIAVNRQQIIRDQNVGRVGRELFPYLIALVALALAVEQVLANRFYRRVE